MFGAERSALDSSVLVLNQHYAAVRVISARRAFCLLVKEIAEIVSVEDQQFLAYDLESWREISQLRARYERENHEWVKCVRFELAVPRIIRLLLYDRLPACVGSTLSINALREDLEVAFETVRNWLLILDRTYATFRVAPLGAPRIRAVKKTQKLYLWDWARVESEGARFENLLAVHLLRLCDYAGEVLRIGDRRG